MVDFFKMKKCITIYFMTTRSQPQGMGATQTRIKIIIID